MALLPYVREAWIEWAVATLVLAVRLYARAKRLGTLRKLQVEDYLMIFAWAVNLTLVLCYHQEGHGTTIVKSATMSAADLREVRRAMMFNFATWPLYVTFIWSLKGCLLIFYSRLVGRTTYRKLIIIAAWGIGLTYIGSILEVMLHCLPIKLTWISYPVPSKHCRAGIDNYLVVGLCNVITDLVLLAIPIPILHQLKVSLRRKIAIGALLCSGLLIIIITILRNVEAYLLTKGNTGNWDSNSLLGWAVRENFIAFVVVNLPCIQPLVSSSPWLKWARLISVRTFFSTRTARNGAGAGEIPSTEAKESTGSDTKNTKSSDSHSFFRVYSSKNLRIFGLSSIDKDEVYTLDVDEKSGSIADAVSREGPLSPPLIPEEAHLVEEHRIPKDIEAGTR